MIKQLLLLVQFLWIFIYQLIFSGDITVSQQLPSQINAGSEAVVEITINKSDITGFAKIQQDFPDGFNAEPIETKGATFSFKDNKVKFIWMSLPSEEQFKVTYKLTPNANVKGDFTLAGKFSFITNSERKNIDIASTSFAVVAEAEEPIAEVPQTPEEEPGVELPESLEEDPVAETPEEEPIVEEPVAITPEVEEPVVNVSCARTVNLIEEGKYKVTAQITKKGIQGFAKITELIPDGFTASEDQSQGGVFSFKDKEAKILWLAMPKGESYEVSYLIEAKPNTINKTYEVSGYFSYLKDDETQKYTIAKTTFSLDREAVVAEEPLKEEPTVNEEPVVEMKEEPTVDEEPIVEVKEKPTTNNTRKEEPENKNKASEVTSIPSPETAVTYKVQVGAGHQTVANNYFAIKFNLKDNVNTETHEGWIKYIVGSFNQYKLARDKRNEVRNNVKTAFVTAYNAGKRITVQEALMISNQKWYK